MGTRIKKNPLHVFEVFCEIAIPSDFNQDPWITWMYPYNFKNKEILKSMPGFAYPCEFNNNAVQHFSFVLTNIDSQWTFGFCRHASHSSSCYVILSYLPWHEVFYKVLNHVAELSSKEKIEKSKQVQSFLENLYQAQIPEPGLELHVLSHKNEDFVAVCPDQEKLPSIPENRNMTEYFNAVDARNMMTIFASYESKMMDGFGHPLINAKFTSPRLLGEKKLRCYYKNEVQIMLHERRILITSKKLSRLSACVQAANALIYPMHWQHIFIPVLPKHLTDYLSAPMPFLIGIPSATLSRMKSADMGDIVFLDADENKIETPFADLDALPSDVLQCLRHDLKHPQEMLGDAVARAFLKALVKLIGGYWNALKLKPGEKITFSPELFVQTRPSSMQPFLQKMLELQIFQQFIESRLKKLNAGRGVSDEFEFELTAHEDKTSFRLRNQYRDWVSNMKKEGGAFFKHVKTKVKDTSKKAYKDIRSRIHDIHNQMTIQDDIPNVPKRRGSVPTSLDIHSAHHRKQHIIKNVYKKENFVASKSKDNQNSQYSTLFETEDVRPNSTDSKKSVLDSPQLSFQPIDTDLMGDLHELIFRQCSLCNSSTQPRTSISDPQLINLVLESEKTPCSHDCIASQLKHSVPENPSNPAPPPLLPRPPCSKNKLNTSITSDRPSPQLLIELDGESSFSEKCSDSLFSVSANSSADKCASQFVNKNSFLLSTLDQPATNLRNLKNTNPFYQSTNMVSLQDSDFSLYKSSSGPNVRNMINLWQSPTSKETECLSSNSDKIRPPSISSSSSYKSQVLARTLSTPPSCSSVCSSTPSMLLLKSASKVSTNPFIVADNKNNNFGRENVNGLSTNSSLSSWENFH